MAFPEADFDWTTSGATLKGILGQTIITSNCNPYTVPGPPRGFSNWRRLVQNDRRDTSCFWSAAPSGQPVTGIQKTIRFPYAVLDELIAGDKQQVVENLIIGFVKEATTTNSSTPWGPPDSSESLDRFGHFLVKVMQPKDVDAVGTAPALKYSSQTFDLGSTAAQKWNGEYEALADYSVTTPPYWKFRGQQIVLERLARITFTIIERKVPPPATGSAETKYKASLYIGYEGGGGY